MQPFPWYSDPTAPPVERPPVWPAAPSPGAPSPGAQPPAVRSSGVRSSGVRSPAAASGPAGVLSELIAGNRRFVAGTARHGHRWVEASAVSADPHPRAVVVGCIDSRVPVEAVLDQGFGDICVVRSAGVVLDRAVSGSVEYAVCRLGVSLVLVLGHHRCSAVAAAVAAARSGRRPGDDLGFVLAGIQVGRATGGSAQDPLLQATRDHVRRTVAALRSAANLREGLAGGRVDVVGALYDPDCGRLEAL